MRFLTSRDSEIVSLKPARARDMVVSLLHIDYLPQPSGAMVLRFVDSLRLGTDTAPP